MITAKRSPQRPNRHDHEPFAPAIAMIPCVLVYVALQRYYVRGLVSGALKG